jgi:hypothetical protein
LLHISSLFLYFAYCVSFQVFLQPCIAYYLVVCFAPAMLTFCSMYIFFPRLSIDTFVSNKSNWNAGLSLKFGMGWHFLTWLLSRLRSLSFMLHFFFSFRLLYIGLQLNFQLFIESQFKIRVQCSLASNELIQHSWWYIEGKVCLYFYSLIL